MCQILEETQLCIITRQDSYLQYFWCIIWRIFIMQSFQLHLLRNNVYKSNLN
jgi:hypothetical protein